MYEEFRPVLYNLEKIFFPVLDVEVGHWFLIIVHVSEQSAEIWDPLIQGRAQSQRVNICQQVAMETVLLTNPELDVVGIERLRGVGSFQVYCELNAPRQPNGLDYGIFVLRFIVDYPSIEALKDDQQ